MPIDYHIDTSRRLVVTMAKGVLTQPELVNHQKMVRDDPEFQWTFWQLHDLRNADVTEVRPECVEALSEFAIPKRGTRSAIVVGSALADQLARMYEWLREGTGEQIRIFRDPETARTWLELAPESSEASSMWPSQERRSSPREQVRITVLLRTGTQKEWVQLVNLSLSGALFEPTSIHLPEGMLVMMSFHPPGRSAAIELTGKVARQTETGIAVQFGELTRDLVQLVRDLL